MKPRKLVLAPKAGRPTQKQIKGRAVNSVPMVNRTGAGEAGDAAPCSGQIHLPG